MTVPRLAVLFLRDCHHILDLIVVHDAAPNVSITSSAAFCSLAFFISTQPTKGQGNSQKSGSHGTNAVLESPAEDEGSTTKEPSATETPRGRHGDQHSPAFVLTEGRPIELLGEPEKGLDYQEGEDQAVGVG